jgi:RNA polymerase sigma-70 factor, ECF subfamily
MHDARDEEDKRLLEAGDHQELVRRYYGVIVDRCRLRVRGEAAYDVAHEVVVRLLSELKRGKRYRVRYRVVVHMVTTWKIKEHFQRSPVQEVELGEVSNPEAGDALAELEQSLDLERAIDGLPPRERDVMRLRWLEGLEIEELAERLGITRNAVDQAHHRALRKLKPFFEGGLP